MRWVEYNLKQTQTWEEIMETKIGQLQAQGLLIGSGEEKDFQKWFLSKEGLPLAFDTFMIYKCFKIDKRLLKSYDNIIALCGFEGTGKSQFAINLAAWISLTFTKNYICFRPEHFFDLLYKCKPGETILIDEGAIFLFSKDTMQKSNKNLIKALTIVRSKCLNIIVCIPSFWILDNYLRSHRCNLLIQVIKRGSYIAYNRAGIAWINIEGGKRKKVLGIRCKSGTFWHGSCYKKTPPQLSWEEYEDLKKANVDLFLREVKEDLEESVRMLRPASKVARSMGVTGLTVSNLIKKGEVEGKQIGGTWYVSNKGYRDLMSMDND